MVNPGTKKIRIGARRLVSIASHLSSGSTMGGILSYNLAAPKLTHRRGTQNTLNFSEKAHCATNPTTKAGENLIKSRRISCNNKTTFKRHEETAIGGSTENSNGLALVAISDRVDTNFNHYVKRLRAITFAILRNNSYHNGGVTT